MKNNITREEYKHRLCQLVHTWKTDAQSDRRFSSSDNLYCWIEGCLPYVGDQAENNGGSEERPQTVLSIEISRHHLGVETYLPEFVLAACKLYAQLILEMAQPALAKQKCNCCGWSNVPDNTACPHCGSVFIPNPPRYETETPFPEGKIYSNLRGFKHPAFSNFSTQ